MAAVAALVTTWTIVPPWSAATAGAPDDAHVWAFGDHARCRDGRPANPAARDVVAVDGAPLLMLGDLVTPTGSTSEYADCFDPVWGGLKPRMRPVPGNHEYQTTGAAGYFAYFDPIAKYYAWDHAGWRFYALNSMCGYAGGCTTAGPQYRWLEQELRTHDGTCQAAYWHHPRWSQGGHGNVAKMAPVYELLVDHGVELLLVAHENGVYQRYPALDATGAPSPTGVTELVVSTGGVDDGAFEVVPNEPAPVARIDGVMGALRLDLTPTSWRAEFVPEAGETATDAAAGTCFDPDAGGTTTTTSTTSTSSTTTTSTSTTTTTAPPTADTVAPVATVRTPARNAVVASPVGFAGSATDDVAVDRVRIAIRDQATRRWLQPDGTWSTTFRLADTSLAARGQPTTTWSATRSLPPGQYGVSIRAVDAAGNAQVADTWVTFAVT